MGWLARALIRGKERREARRAARRARRAERRSARQKRKQARQARRAKRRAEHPGRGRRIAAALMIAFGTVLEITGVGAAAGAALQVGGGVLAATS